MDLKSILKQKELSLQTMTRVSQLSIRYRETCHKRGPVITKFKGTMRYNYNFVRTELFDPYFLILVIAVALLLSCEYEISFFNLSRKICPLWVVI